jgi:hypothetical protein
MEQLDETSYARERRTYLIRVIYFNWLCVV